MKMRRGEFLLAYSNSLGSDFSRMSTQVLSSIPGYFVPKLLAKIDQCVYVSEDPQFHHADSEN